MSLKCKRERDWFSKSYIRWRQAVYKRDDWCCRICKRGLKTKPRRLVEAHHIRPWASHPKLRFVVSNGITLCRRCHRRVTGREREFTKRFEKDLKRRGKWKRRSPVRSVRKR